MLMNEDLHSKKNKVTCDLFLNQMAKNTLDVPVDGFLFREEKSVIMTTLRLSVSALIV